jgi:intron-binding protein aquarius
MQVEAIRSGSSPGLSLIVGPPGTGKTDVAVQIMCNLYHGRCNERILLLTHSNQALNQLFEKLLMLNHIPERHLLRLGHTEDDVISNYDQYGRITHFMVRYLFVHGFT